MDTRQISLNQSDEPAGKLELVGEASRQALPLFKGIDYQIWQTVLAWTDLGEDESLVVEGAEDFDVLSKTIATANQIKDIVAPVSLRSPCISEALRNFWITRHKNPGRRIKYRLITTADLSVEAREPFGASKPGLELWNDEAHRATPLHSALLKDFLLLDDSISKRLAEPFGEGVPSLTEYLSQLSPESFHSEFIHAIQWLPRQPDIEVIRDMVRIRLNAYGEDKHLLARDCERALAPLFVHVAHAAIRQRRLLQRDDFRVLFDESTRVSLPISQANQMQAAFTALQPQSPRTLVVNFSAAETGAMPDLPVPCAQRAELVNTLGKCVSERGFVAIQGSTGMGKSTLAKLAACKMGGNWLWTSFAGWEGERVSAGIQQLASQIAASSDPASLLLDDFNPIPVDLLHLLQRLAVLSRLTLMRGGRLIVTTQRFLGTVFLRQSNLPPQVLQQVTPFTAEEVQDLCLQAGCPADSRLKPLANIISIQTACHPQLVHARVKVANRLGWPTPTINDYLTTPQEITDERQLARQLLHGLDEGEVQLLYRLSLASQPFRKDHVIAAGEISPAISRPGDKFVALLGPWIEPVGNSSFRLSSLLGRAAEENWTSERVRTLRIHYAVAVQRCGQMTLREASEILFQAVVAKEAAVAMPILASLFLMPIDSRKNCAHALEWMLPLGDPSLIFSTNKFATYLFVLMQFRIAAVLDRASAPQFAERLYEAAMKPINPKSDAHTIVMTVTEILIAFQVLVRPSLLLKWWLKMARLTRQNGQVRKIAHAAERAWPPLDHKFPKQSYDDILFSFILSRRGSIAYLREFVESVDSLSLAERRKVVAGMKANRFRLYGFVDNSWTSELMKQRPDWNEAIVALKETYGAGERWGASDLSMVAARGIAAIQDEYLENRDGALKTLAEAAIRVGNGLLLRYQRGMVYYLHKEYMQAYEAWLSTFDDWPTDSEEAALDAFNAFSNCGAAAGFLNRWDDAAAAFSRGRDLALNVGRDLDALKFGIDAAYAQWRSNSKKEAIAALAQHLSAMEELQRSETSSEFHTQWKLTEHIIAWCGSDAGAQRDPKIVAPRPGICSEAKSSEKHDLVKDQARAPVLLIWYLLAEAELYAKQGCHAFSLILARSDLNNDPNLSPMIDFLRERKAIADGEFEGIPEIAEAAALGFTRIGAKNGSSSTDLKTSPSVSSNTKRIPSIASQVEETILCALLAISAQGLPWESVLSKWSTSASRMQDPTILTNALERIRRICSATPSEIYHQYIIGTSPRFTQVVAGLQLVVHPEAKPEFCYVGLCALVMDDGFATNLMLSHDYLARLTRKTWLAQISAPFALCSPRLTVPAIKSACECGKQGLALAATILLAAGDAVKVKKSENVMQKLRDLAAGRIEKKVAQL